MFRWEDPAGYRTMLHAPQRLGSTARRRGSAAVRGPWPGQPASRYRPMGSPSVAAASRSPVPTIKPFRALRYEPEAVGDLGLVTSPPYDVIDPAGQRSLMARHPKN